MADKDYPVGVAQKQVLDALGLTATGFNDAQRRFDDLGISVASRREGRKSVPVVHVTGWGGGFIDGEGQEWTGPKREILDKLQQWIN